MLGTWNIRAVNDPAPGGPPHCIHVRDPHGNVVDLRDRDGQRWLVGSVGGVLQAQLHEHDRPRREHHRLRSTTEKV